MAVIKGEQVGIHIKFIPTITGNVIFEFFGFHQLLQQGDSPKRLARFEALKHLSPFSRTLHLRLHKGIPHRVFRALSQDFRNLNERAPLFNEQALDFLNFLGRKSRLCSQNEPPRLTITSLKSP